VIIIRVGLLAAALGMSVGYAQAENWYFAHFGQETCVPIDDVEIHNLKRLYYHTGDMHTPQQVKQAWESIGIRLVDRPTSIPGAVSFDSQDGTVLMLFNDESLCKHLMSQLPP
jgi:hypothetical protein